MVSQQRSHPLRSPTQAAVGAHGQAQKRNQATVSRTGSRRLFLFWYALWQISDEVRGCFETADAVPVFPDQDRLREEGEQLPAENGRAETGVEIGDGEHDPVGVLRAVDSVILDQRLRRFKRKIGGEPFLQLSDGLPGQIEIPVPKRPEFRGVCEHIVEPEAPCGERRRCEQRDLHMYDFVPPYAVKPG